MASPSYKFLYIEWLPCTADEVSSVSIKRSDKVILEEEEGDDGSIKVGGVVSLTEKSKNGLRRVTGKILSVHDTYKSANAALQKECQSINKITEVVSENSIRKRSKKKLDDFVSDSENCDQNHNEAKSRKLGHSKKKEMGVKQHKKENVDPKKNSKQEQTQSIIEKLKKASSETSDNQLKEVNMNVRIKSNASESDQNALKNDTSPLKESEPHGDELSSQQKNATNKSIKTDKLTNQTVQQYSIDPALFEESMQTQQLCSSKNLAQSKKDDVIRNEEPIPNQPGPLKAIENNDQIIDSQVNSTHHPNILLKQDKNVTPSKKNEFQRALQHSPQSIPGGSQYESILTPLLPRKESLSESGSLVFNSLSMLNGSFMGELDATPVDFNNQQHTFIANSAKKSTPMNFEENKHCINYDDEVNTDNNQLFITMQSEMRDLRRDIKMLKQNYDRQSVFISKLMQDLEKRQAVSSNSVADVDLQGISKEELFNLCKGQTTWGDAVRKLAHFLFTDETLVACTVRGRQTCPGSGQRPALDKKKLTCLINTVIEYFQGEKITERAITDKLSNHMKALRKKNENERSRSSEVNKS